ncbi:MAG: LysM peptidoglycan-binding domain-containing protein [Anaerolineales bacterium]|nr:LysM peptidoglycan-binding domain-containing protein [Anaerolineales bacterium]
MKTPNMLLILLIVLPIIAVTGFCASTIPAILGLSKATETPSVDPQVLTQVASIFGTQTAVSLAPTQTPIPTLEIPIVLPTTAEPILNTPTLLAMPEAAVPHKYRLHTGEFPFCLARRFNVNPDELMALNGFWYGQVFYDGQIVRIPQSGNPFPWQRSLRPRPNTYSVQPGDTIYSIACFYGDLDPINLAAANGLDKPYRLSAGQTLNIPADGAILALPETQIVQIPTLAPTWTPTVIPTTVSTTVAPTAPPAPTETPVPTALIPTAIATTEITATAGPISTPIIPETRAATADRKTAFYLGFSKAQLDPSTVANAQTYPNPAETALVDPGRLRGVGDSSCVSGDETSYSLDNELHHTVWILSCGWQANETIQVTFRYPNGDIAWAGPLVTQGEPKPGLYFSFENLITDPPGVYQVTLTGQTSKYIRNFAIPFKKPEGGRVQLDQANGTLFLYNFSPNEKVALYVYRVDANLPGLTAMGSQEFQVDGNGRLLLEILNYAQNASVYQYLVVSATTGPAASSLR